MSRAFFLVLLLFPICAFAEPVAGDLVSGAQPLEWPANPAKHSYGNLTTVGSNFEKGEPAHGGATAARSVWWKFTAGSTGAAAVRVNFGDRKTGSFGFYEGSTLAKLSPVNALNQNAGIYPVTAGKSYLIAANDSKDVTGSVGVRLTHLNLVQYPNDDFSSRKEIAGEKSDDYFRFPEVRDAWYYGSVEEGEPKVEEKKGGETLWWEFSAPTSGWFAIRKNAVAFSGNSLSSLTPIAPTPLHAAYHYYQLEKGQKVVFRLSVPELAGSSASFLVRESSGYDTFILNAGVPVGQHEYQSNPAGDGIDNLTKFVLGLHPAKKTSEDPNVKHLPTVSRREDGKYEVAYTIDVKAANFFFDQEKADCFYISPHYTSDLSKWIRLGDRYERQDEAVPFKEFRLPLPPDVDPTKSRLDLKISVQFEHYMGSG